MPPHPFPGLENEGMSLGTVVAGGLRFTITSVSLLRGQLVITAIRPGPVPAMENEPAAIFGSDGVGFGQGPAEAGASITIREASQVEMAMVTLKIKMTTLTAGTV